MIVNQDAKGITSKNCSRLPPDFLLVLYLDGVKREYLSRETMPFLADIVSSFEIHEMTPLLGYSDAIEASILTGKYPEVNGYWCRYHFTSCERKLGILWRALRVSDFIPQGIPRSAVNFITSKVGRFLVRRFRAPDYIVSDNVPRSLLSWFSQSPYSVSSNLHLCSDNLLSILESNNIGWCYRDSHSSDFGKQTMNVHILYFADADAYAHRYGIGSESFTRRLRILDTKIGRAVLRAQKRYRNLRVLVLSDHGMADVSEIIDPDFLLPSNPVRAGYIPFIDSTMARFKYLTEAGRVSVQTSLSRLSKGHVLTEREKMEQRINFPDRKYGDDVYLLEEGYAFSPSFVSWLEPKAMHGYWPSLKSQKGILSFLGESLNVNSLRRSDVRTVDVLPIILNIMGVSETSVRSG